MGWFETALSWLMFVALLTSRMIHSTGSEIQCQHRPCRCVNKLKVNCSHLLLTEVPSSLGTDADMLILDVSGNHITRLNASLLPNQLKVLQLSENRIKTLGKSDLYMLRNLIFLHLDKNDISYIHPDALSRNSRLEILTLSGNLWSSETSNDIYKQPFLNTPVLRVLDISNCSLRMISDIMFSKMQHIEDLRLSFNHLRSLEGGTFQHLTSLRSLSLRKNFLNKLQKGAFRSLGKLEVLDLAENYLSFLDESELFTQLTNLKYLDVSGNGLKHLHPNIFSKLHSLKTLYLNQNLLNYFDDMVFRGLAQLDTLDISDNSIETIPYHTVFCETNQLSYLKLTSRFTTCDNCSMWNIWQWKNSRNITAFLAKCSGKDVDSVFNDHITRQELLRSLTNCSLLSACESKSDEVLETSSSYLYIYAITGAILLLLVSGSAIGIFLFRRHFYGKQKQNASNITVSPVLEETHNEPEANAEPSHVNEELKKRQELHQKAEEERLKLQRELYVQHQKTIKRHQQQRYRETLERSRQERDSTSQVPTEDNLSVSKGPETTSSGAAYHREIDTSRLPSVADDEKEWCRADTLPMRDYKFKTVHGCTAAVACDNNKREIKRCSADEALTRRIEDEYWDAKKKGNRVESTEGATNECEEPIEIAFCQDAAPACKAKLSDEMI